MPKVNPGESRSDFVSRCVRTVMGEGLTQEQAVGKCEGMYDSHLEKSMDADPLGSVLGNVGRGVAKEDDEEYEDEVSEDAGFDPEELAAGEREELEHGDADEAHEIAEDHLREDPDYYLKLDDAGLMDDPLGQALARMESKE